MELVDKECSSGPEQGIPTPFTLGTCAKAVSGPAAVTKIQIQTCRDQAMDFAVAVTGNLLRHFSASTLVKATSS